MENPFLQTIRDQWVPVAEAEVERRNIRAITDYRVKQSNWVVNWQQQGAAYESVVPYPVPDKVSVVGMVPFEHAGNTYQIPGPVQGDEPVCDPIPKPQREVAPNGIIAEFSAPIDPNNPFGLWRAGRWTTAPNGHRAKNPHNGVTYKLVIVQGPIGRHIWWEPAGEV